MRGQNQLRNHYLLDLYYPLFIIIIQLLWEHDESVWLWERRVMLGLPKMAQYSPITTHHVWVVAQDCVNFGGLSIFWERMMRVIYLDSV